MKLKVVKKRKAGKKKEQPQKPKTEVKYLEAPYTTAILGLLRTDGNLDTIEKELNRKPPRGISYFFHQRDFMHVLHRVKLNSLSVEDLHRWSGMVRARLGNPVYFIDETPGEIFVTSFARLAKLQDENKLTREAAIAILDDFPIELEQWINFNDFKVMKVVGKKKKMAKVKSFRKEK